MAAASERSARRLPGRPLADTLARGRIGRLFPAGGYRRLRTRLLHGAGRDFLELLRERAPPLQRIHDPAPGLAAPRRTRFARHFLGRLAARSVRWLGSRRL